MDIRFEEAPDEVRHIINVTPRDGDWHEIDGYYILIDDYEACIYEPGSTQRGECDLYVKLNKPIDVLAALEKAAMKEWFDKKWIHQAAASQIPSYDVMESAFAKWQDAYCELKDARAAEPEPANVCPSCGETIDDGDHKHCVECRMVFVREEGF